MYSIWNRLFLWIFVKGEWGEILFNFDVLESGEVDRVGMGMGMGMIRSNLFEN